MYVQQCLYSSNRYIHNVTACLNSDVPLLAGLSDPTQSLLYRARDGVKKDKEKEMLYSKFERVDSLTD